MARLTAGGRASPANPAHHRHAHGAGGQDAARDGDEEEPQTLALDAQGEGHGGGGEENQGRRVQAAPTRGGGDPGSGVFSPEQLLERRVFVLATPSVVLGAAFVPIPEEVVLLRSGH
jgi:hypothetical protein